MSADPTAGVAVPPLEAETRAALTAVLCNYRDSWADDSYIGPVETGDIVDKAWTLLYPAARRAVLAERTRTHHAECWRGYGHHNCAVAKIAELERLTRHYDALLNAAETEIARRTREASDA